MIIYYFSILGYKLKMLIGKSMGIFSYILYNPYYFNEGNNDYFSYSINKVNNDYFLD